MFAAIAQLISTPVISTNIAKCQSLISRAAKRGAQIIYLPEASDFIAPSAQVLSMTTSLNESSFVKGIQSQARQSGIWVGVGVHESSDEPGRIFNSHLLIDNNGEILLNYRKLHLFDVDIKGGMKIKESATTKPGTIIQGPVSTPVGKLALLTCYDLRFPEQSLLLRKQGAQILTYPSAFTPKTGEAHWEALLRARAIETQCYVFAPAQGPGEHFPSRIVQYDGEPKIQPGRASHGNAMCIDPYGTVIAKCATSSSLTSQCDNNNDTNADIPDGDVDGQLCFAEIDLDFLERIRAEMPLWEQRRNDVYHVAQL